MAMICLYRDSFDYDESALTLYRGWTKGEASGGNVTINTTNPLTGYACVHCDGGSAGTSRISRFLTEAQDDLASLSLRFHTRVIDLADATGEQMASLLSGGPVGTTQIGIRHDGSGTLTVFAGGADRLTTASGTIVQATDHHIELVVKIANSGGFVTLYVDGTQVGTFSGDTQNTSATVNALRLHDAGTNSYIADYDDLSVWADDAAGDATQMGVHRVGSKLVTADTGVADWAPSAGSDLFAMVDEQSADGDATYLSTATDGDQARFTGEVVEGTAGTIQGASVVAIARKTDAAARNLLVGAADGANEDLSAGQALTTTYTAYYHHFYDMPGGAALIPSDITALELMIEADQ